MLRIEVDKGMGCLIPFCFSKFLVCQNTFSKVFLHQNIILCFLFYTLTRPKILRQIYSKVLRFEKKSGW